MTQKIKVFGERNTGTNYVHQLLTRNLRTPVDPGVVPQWWKTLLGGSERRRDTYFSLTERWNGGWKHRDVTPLLQRGRIPDWFFVCVTKNPYAWALSMHRRSQHRKVRAASFLELIVQPWETVGRETGPDRYESLIHMWNEKHAAYAALCSRAKGRIVRYEDLLSDPVGTLEAIAHAAGAKLVNEPENILDSTKGDDKSFSDYRTYYLGEAWRRELPDDAHAAIDARVDRGVLSRIGYDR